MVAAVRMALYQMGQLTRVESTVKRLWQSSSNELHALCGEMMHLAETMAPAPKLLLQVQPCFD